LAKGLVMSSWGDMEDIGVFWVGFFGWGKGGEGEGGEVGLWGLEGGGGLSLFQWDVVAADRLRLVECSRSSSMMSPWVLTVMALR
jgi:hypothetical protein